MMDIQIEKIIQEIKKITEYLETNNINYLLLECEIEFKKKCNSGIFTDFDIYIEKARSRKELKKTLINNNWFEEKSFRFTSTRMFFAKYICGNKLKLDISEYISVFSSNNNIESRYIKKVDFQIGIYGFYFLSDDVAANLILNKAILNKAISNTKINTLHELTLTDNKQLGNLKDITEKNYMEYKYVVRKNFSNILHKINLFRYVFLYTYQFFPLKYNKCIAFIGMDGSGKGTYINLLVDDLHRKNFTFKVIYFGHSNYELGIIKFIVKIKNDESQSNIIRKFFRWLYLIFLPFEFIYRRGFGKVDVIIIDRHPSFEPIMSNKVVKILYHGLLNFIVPKPNKFLYLTGSSKLLWGRKKESRYSIFVLRSKELDDIVTKELNKNIIKINTTNNISRVYTHVWQEFKTS